MEYGVRTRAATARKTHRCSECGRRILGGHRYLRHTYFPGHDANTSKRPFAELECLDCVGKRDDTDPMLLAGACASYCHGVNPCVLPFKHGGECWCRVETDALTIPTREEQAHA